MRFYSPAFLTYTRYIAGVVFISLLAPPAMAEDLDAFADRAISHLEKMEIDIRDMTLRQNATINAGGDRVMNQKMVIYRKGVMSRSEIVTTTPSQEDAIINLGPITSIVINDGKETWSYSSMTGATKADKPQKSDISKPGWMENIRKGGKIKGSEKIHGRDCLVIDYKDEGKPSTAWIDKETFFLVKRVTTQNGEMATLLLSDFKKLDDKYLWPWKMEILRDGAPVVTASVTSISVNTGLLDSLFDVEEIKAKKGNMEIFKRMLQGGK